MKRLFISQPMRGKTDEEILKERVFKVTGEECDVIETFMPIFSPETKPLVYLSQPIKDLVTADIAIFIGDCKNYRGCRIKNTCTVEYGIDIIK